MTDRLGFIVVRANGKIIGELSSEADALRRAAEWDEKNPGDPLPCRVCIVSVKHHIAIPS